jgi:hypothetical protein
LVDRNIFELYRVLQSGIVVLDGPNFMDKSKRTAIYKRAPETRGTNAPYEQKFANLIKLCEKSKAEGVENLIVSWPWVIGDTNEEVIESLSRISDAGLVLHIVERWDPKNPHFRR